MNIKYKIQINLQKRLKYFFMFLTVYCRFNIVSDIFCKLVKKIVFSFFSII